MKKKSWEELKTKSVRQLKEIIGGLEKEIIVGKIERQQSKVKNVHAVNQKRKDIARAKTILQSKLLLEKKETGNAAH